MRKLSLLVLITIFLTGCAEGEVTKAEVEMFNDVGDSLGTIKLQEQADGVKLSLNLKGLTPGIHGIHIHETNKCDAPDFQSAGNHFNPDNKEHGLLHPEGAHAGDLPNILVKEDGTVKAELMAPQVTLRDGKKSLFSKKGTSIVITEQQDDGMTQPAGDSGERIACGSIKKK
ncbi:superoxide dismutase family protein [Niallia sp. FSL W8-0951]|jgi:superoxide dismutase, Cu-Zn family|uniref:superoxide dismutase family protein n=1 Tax=unclassified Niallia TaxID=2837522 RepID=UPI0030F60F1A